MGNAGLRLDRRFALRLATVGLGTCLLTMEAPPLARVNAVNRRFVRLALSPAARCGDYDSSRRELTALIAGPNGGRSGLYGLKVILSYVLPGEHLTKSGALTEALACYESGFGPTREILRIRKPYEQLKAGSYIRPLSYYQALLPLHAGSILLYGLKRPGQARQVLQQGTEMSPAMSELYAVLAQACLWSGDRAGALTAAQESMRIKESPLALEIIASVRESEEDFAAASRYLERAWSIDHSRTQDLRDAAALRLRTRDCGRALRDVLMLSSVGGVDSTRDLAAVDVVCH